jgi:hypothetical protein
VTDESGAWAAYDEPSWEDFEAAEAEDQQLRQRGSRFRILRAVGILIVVLALVLYLVVPRFVYFSGRSLHVRLPTTRTRPIPLAPAHESPPKAPA